MFVVCCVATAKIFPKEIPMSKPSRYLVASAALALLILSGCQNSGSSAPTATATPSQRAIVVSGGNTGTYTVFLSSVDPNDPVVMCSSGQTVCPECKAAAIKYFQTGVLDPKCSRTGASRYPVVAVDQSVGHQ
jgi:hypothetical protein